MRMMIRAKYMNALKLLIL